MKEKRIKVAFFIPSIKEKAGVYRYCFEILKNLPQRGSGIYFYCFHFPDNLLVRELRESMVDHQNVYEFVEIKTPFDFRKKISALDIDIVHFLAPDLLSLFLSFLTPKIFFKIITIHDLYCFEFKFNPHLYSFKEKIRKYFLKLRAGSFNEFIAVSGNTAKNINKFLNISPEKILTVYPGISHKFFDFRSITCPDGNGNYILSNRLWTPFLLILKDFFEIFPDFKIIIFATKNAAAKGIITEIAEKLNITNKLIFKIDISDEELICLYQNAKLFVRYMGSEGFGFPVAEAMACSCPVLVSDRGSLPEVVGIPDLIIPLGYREKWLEMMKKIIKNKDFRKSVIRKEKERAENFKWAYAMDKTINVYRALMSWRENGG